MFYRLILLFNRMSKPAKVAVMLIISAVVAVMTAVAVDSSGWIDLKAFAGCLTIMMLVERAFHSRPGKRELLLIAAALVFALTTGLLKAALLWVYSMMSYVITLLSIILIYVVLPIVPFAFFIYCLYRITG